MAGTTGMTQLSPSNTTMTMTNNGQMNGACSTLFLTGFPEHDFKNMSFAVYVQQATNTHRVYRAMFMSMPLFSRSSPGKTL
jgi:hypothetical protein